jgi:hypothetical protein
LNVTTTVTLGPALDAPSTTTTLVADAMVQDVTVIPPTVAAQLAGYMKLAPVTVILLPI